MDPTHISAIRSIFASSLEKFFASKSDKEIQAMILAPYREAREDFERGLLMKRTTDDVASV